MPVMSNQPYNIPGIPQDLRRDETVHQIVDSLTYFDKIANDVFTKIHNRVLDNKSKLQKLNDRVNLAQAKVDKIKGSNKATKVFASAKYPAPDTTEIYPSLFQADSNNTLHVTKRPNYHVSTKFRPVDDTMMREKLQYYSVKRGQKKKPDETRGEGLGGLPKTIPSISALLLFNTSENPYKKYVMLDPLGVVTKTRTSLEDEEVTMADAPSTIRTNEELLRQQKENFLYIPNMGVVPEISVPDFLPNLSSVADDLFYSAELEQSIAPTLFGGGSLELPTNLPVPDAPPPEGSAPPPPPPGPPPPGPPPDAPPPPPPPDAPPPPPPTIPPPPAPPGDAPPIPAEVSSGGGGRASLMDSIRKAGVKIDKKDAKAKRKETRKKKEEKKSGGGGDLMTDLLSRLVNRRKGISGTGKPGEGGGEKAAESLGGGTTTMGKISSMIPAPPRPEGGGGGGDDEGDWN